MNETVGFSLATVVGLSLLGCFGDTPQEPEASGAPVRLASAAITSNITDLGTLGGDFSEASDINSSGRIVGNAAILSINGSFELHAAYWQNGIITDLSTLPGASSAWDATGISDAGHIVGRSTDPNTGGGFLLSDGRMTGLPHLTGDQTAWPLRVNSSGLVVGGSWNEADGHFRPVLWQNGSVRYLGSFGGEFGTASDINDNGQVAGFSQMSSGHEHAFLWQNGSMRDLGTLGGLASAGSAINAVGQVVGGSSLSNGRSRAFLWQNGRMLALGTLGGPFSYASDVNDQGQAVGSSETASGQSHAFWWHDGIMTDLGTLGGPSSSASAIDETGHVVGNADDAGFHEHAVLWTLPSVNFWTSRARLSSGRQNHSIAVANGLLYAIGGSNSAGIILVAVQSYNPATNAWTSRPPLPLPRTIANGAATINGTIYLAGGVNSAGKMVRTLYAYNSSTNTWTERAQMPVAASAGGSAVIDNKLYVFSGRALVNGAETFVGLLHRYDPSTNSWTRLRPAPVVHFRPAVGAIAGKLYVAGGDNALGAATRRLDVYDPATNTWTTKASMATARSSMASLVVGGRLYVIGGRNGTTYQDAVETYEPTFNTWATRARLPTARAELAAGATSQLIYAIGGAHTPGLLALNERYTP
jgi:probable HAF family extracellular repeat protein